MPAATRPIETLSFGSTVRALGAYAPLNISTVRGKKNITFVIGDLSMFDAAAFTLSLVGVKFCRTGVGEFVAAMGTKMLADLCGS